MSSKKLSIIIPTLNRPTQLSRVVDKISSLLTSDIEIIVIDDSLERWDSVSKPKCEGIQYIHRGKKKGVSSARNLGAKVAQGEYLLFLDDDDDFSDSWIADFLASITLLPEMAFCEMRRIESHGTERIERAQVDTQGKLLHALFIPGSWVIQKNFFEKVGGYDERLTYAENTELFIRISNHGAYVQLISKPNFMYYPSIDGGSKNLRNMVDSLNLILTIHDSSLSSHVKHLYHQIIGVNFIRFREFSKSRKHLASAYYFKPWKLSTLGRLMIACCPPLACKLYSVTVKNG